MSGKSEEEEHECTDELGDGRDEVRLRCGQRVTLAVGWENAMILGRIRAMAVQAIAMFTIHGDGLDGDEAESLTPGILG